MGAQITSPHLMAGGSLESGSVSLSALLSMIESTGIIAAAPTEKSIISNIAKISSGLVGIARRLMALIESQSHIGYNLNR